MSWIPDEWPQLSLATRLEVDCSRGRTRSRAMAMKNISLEIDDHLARDLSKCWGSSVGRQKEENSNLQSGAKVDSNVYYTHTSHYLSPALDECNLLSINEAVQEEEKKQFSSLLAALKFPSNWTTQLDLRHGMSSSLFFRWSGWSMWVVVGALEQNRRQSAPLNGEENENDEVLGRYRRYFLRSEAARRQSSDEFGGGEREEIEEIWKTLISCCSWLCVRMQCRFYTKLWSVDKVFYVDTLLMAPADALFPPMLLSLNSCEAALIYDNCFSEQHRETESHWKMSTTIIVSVRFWRGSSWIMSSERVCSSFSIKNLFFNDYSFVSAAQRAVISITTITFHSVIIVFIIISFWGWNWFRWQLENAAKLFLFFRHHRDVSIECKCLCIRK